MPDDPTKSVRDALDVAVDALSSKVRQVVLGTLAIVWLFLAGGSSVPVLKIAASNGPLFGIAAWCITSLVLDGLQSLFAYLSLKSVLDVAEANKGTDVWFDETDWRRRLQFFCFYAKMVAGAVGAVWLVILLAFAIK